MAISRSMRIASIPADLRDRIALHAIADNQSELLALAAEPTERQAQVVALLTAEPAQAGSVADALALVDRLPAPKAAVRWEKFSDAFSRMKEKEQDAFFDLQEGAIRRWLAKRGQA
jgi:ParB family chromosome partitioning protein